MLQVLKEKLLYAKLYKCELFLHKFSFLGHVIFGVGIAVDPSKVDVVLQWEAPKTVTEIISFLGLVGYYRRFIEGFFQVSSTFDSVDLKGPSICVGYPM